MRVTFISKLQCILKHFQKMPHSCQLDTVFHLMAYILELLFSATVYASEELRRHSNNLLYIHPFQIAFINCNHTNFSNDTSTYEGTSLLFNASVPNCCCSWLNQVSEQAKQMAVFVWDRNQVFLDGHTSMNSVMTGHSNFRDGIISRSL